MKLLTSKTFDRLALARAPRFKILQGGSSSSKTFSILQYLVLLALKSKKAKLVSIVAETLPALRRGALRDFINILGDTYDIKMHNKSEGTYRIGLWLFEFFGADNSSRLRGARRNILFINECNNVKFEAYSQLEMRTSEKVFLDFNPSSEFWVHNELMPSLKEDEYFFDVSTYHDNQYAPPNVIASIERRKFDSNGEVTEFYKVYGLGQIGSLEGVVYDEWEQVVLFPDDAEGIVYGLDFGFSVDPAALVKVAIKNENVYLKEIFYQTELTNQDIVAKFGEHKLIKGRDIVYADSAEPKSIAEIRKGGYIIRPAIKGPDSLRTGIDWLKSHKIKVTKDSVNLIKELRNYTWEKDKDGKALPKPVDAWNHLLDAVRYSISNKITNTRVLTKRMVF